MSEWDFYACEIDGRPASIYLDLQYARIGPPVGADTHFVARIAMLDLGAHGMGTLEEANTLRAVESALEEALVPHEIVYVGRIRTHGVWQMSFYGPASAREKFEVTVPERVTTVEASYDPAWSFYEHTLSPSIERRQWMLDRAVVEQLEERGDPLGPRKVEHWAYFESSEARDAYVAAATRDGFVFEALDQDEPGSFVARVSRVDSVEHEVIHAAVMILVEHAVANGGRYDGWECPVEAS